MLKLYNTLTKKKETFVPLHNREVRMYTCGPTVYNYAHIGNLRTYVFEDILKRVLLYNGYKVKHVMNITDVGHLTDDADQGEDKMEKGARREGKTAWEIADFYTKAFKKDIIDLNILSPNIWCKATDHIKEQIKLVQTLIKKGYTYETNDGIYFDTTKLSDYGQLANLKKQQLKAGARVELGEKKNLHDFALWKFTPKGEKRQMEWSAFGKKGFPGWHLECSTMALKYLGNAFRSNQFYGERSRTIDIHCGGIDHVPIHHTNEIAQSEAATGQKPWVKYWLHGEWLIVGDDKMSKSEENFLTLQTIKNRGLSPVAYRYFLLQTHYRKQLTFSWEALQAAQQGLDHLYNILRDWTKEKPRLGQPHRLVNCAEYEQKFIDLINDDLNMPEAVALMWDLVKSDYPPHAKKASLFKFDQILGLGLDKVKKLKMKIPDAVQKLLKQRAQERKDKNWGESDRLREKIIRLGYMVEDTEEGQRVSKKFRN